MIPLLPHRLTDVVDQSGTMTDDYLGFFYSLLQALFPQPIIVSTSRQTDPDNGLYILTASVTLTLSQPNDMDRIVVHRNYAGSNSTIDGDGLDINGSGTYTMSTDRETVTLLYLQVLDEWIIV